MNRPSLASLQSVYEELFQTSLDKLRASALDGRIFYTTQNECVPGRSIAWKLFLSHRPPLTARLNPHPVPPLNSLRRSRQRYVAMLKEKMCAPDGSYEEGFHSPKEVSHRPISPPTHKKPHDWTLNNPLSLDSSNPWHAYFSALELRDTIRQDVERTFPEDPYFRSPAVQTEMSYILFLHVSEREHVGYRQGMHELLACVYKAVDFDSVEKSQNLPDLAELCDREYVAADAFALFGVIMQRMELWYEWRPQLTDPVSPASPAHHTTHSSVNGEIVSLPARESQIGMLDNGQLELQPYVAPIVAICASLRDEILKIVDPHLWEKLRDGGVEAQMYGMRWLRLLFTREFPLGEAMILWDALFASICEDATSPSPSSAQQGFQLALWISVAMLMRIRNKLISGDYTEQLTNLLRYPSPSALGGSNTNAPGLLLRQAQLLMASPLPATGVSVVMQNRNELGIPIEVPDPLILSPARQRRRGSATAPPTVPASQSKTSLPHDRSRLQDVIANRLIDANESLGIQRGFFNTITELRKSFPDFSQTRTRTPSLSGSSISLADERGTTSVPARSSATSVPEVTEWPPWEPRPRSEIEREIADLRALLKTLGHAVGSAVDVLLLDEETKDVDEAQKLRGKKMEAVQCMSYVRDVLARGGEGGVDEGRLVIQGECDRQHRAKQETAAAAKPRPPVPNPVLPPAQVASSADSPDSVAEPHLMLSTRESTRPIQFLTRTPVSNSQIATTSNAPPPAKTTSTTKLARSNSNPPMAPSTTSPVGTTKSPWQHRPSNFSDDSPQRTARIPPSSTTALPRFDRATPPTKHGSPRADPLGVIRGHT